MCVKCNERKTNKLLYKFIHDSEGTSVESQVRKQVNKSERKETD